MRFWRSRTVWTWPTRFAALSRDYSSEPEDLNERLSAPLVALVAPDTQNALRRLSEFEDPFASRARVTGEQVIDEVRPDLMEDRAPAQCRAGGVGRTLASCNVRVRQRTP